MLFYLFHKLYEISGLNNFHWINVGYLVLAAVAALLIEFIFIPDKKESSFFKLSKFNRSTRIDLICWIIDLFGLFQFFAVLITLGIFYKLSGLLQKNVHLDLTIHIGNPVVQFILIFLANDLKNYLKHRLFHKYTPLWKLHEFHHSSTTLNVLTLHRGHFGEAAISVVFDVIPFILLGAPAYYILWVNYISEVHQLLLHSGLNSRWGVIGKYVLVSPADHKIHHSSQERHYNKNFGSSFIFWDRIFQTYYPSNHEVFEIGVPDNPHNKRGFLYDVWISYKLSFKMLWKKFKHNE